MEENVQAKMVDWQRIYDFMVKEHWTKLVAETDSLKDAYALEAVTQMIDDRLVEPE